MNTNIEQVRGQLENLRDKIDESRRDLTFDVERLLGIIADVFGGLDDEVNDLSNEIDNLEE